MKNLLKVFLIILGSTFILGSPSNQCTNNDGCLCLNSMNEYEFQCPKFDYKVVIHMKRDKEMVVECMDNFKYFDLKIFPNYTAGDVEFLNIKYCPLPEDGFQSLLHKFGINKLIFFRFKISEYSRTKRITNEFFKGMSSLKALIIDWGNATYDENFLEFLPNLTSLDLGRSNLKEIGYIFKHTPMLQQLYLPHTSIKEIPDGLFENLIHLKILHLWQNQLTILKKDHFRGLVNLRSLEVSSNRIHSIEPYTFSELPLLVNISFYSNNLGHVGPKLFSNNSKLKTIRIAMQTNLTLADKCFAYLNDLTSLYMANSNLKNIPENVFEGSTNIEVLLLQNNLLVELSVGTFKELRKLKKLNIAANRISSLPDEIFSNTDHLEELDLSHNLLAAVGENTFNARNLKKLSLNDNAISEVNLGDFSSDNKLIHLDLSNNNITLNTDFDQFTLCQDLEELDLHGNQLSGFPCQIMYMVHLKTLNLSENQITNISVIELFSLSRLNIDLRYNKISLIDLHTVEAFETIKENSSTVVDLEHNAIICDCRNYDFIRYLNDFFPVVQSRLDLRLGESQCAEPESFRHISISDLKPRHISCLYEGAGCPHECQCSERPFDETVVVKCDNRNLTDWPIIGFNASKIELDLTGNMLTQSPDVSRQNNNITNLFLSNNRLENMEWIPLKIQVIKLDGNKLTHLDSSLLKQLSNSSTLTNISLNDNPWTCGCIAFDLYNFITANYIKVNELPNILCEEDKEPLRDKIILCSYPIHLLQISIPIVIFVLVILGLMVLYAFYRQEIKIWLYANNLCLWFVTEEDLDQDMEYDIFLSYSHKDEDFVINNLLPVLEEGPRPYKICIHVRDFIGGEFIINHVTNSVLNSKRTLVVLSNNFSESSWGKLEFRMAHTHGVEEGRTRLIVIKYGELNEDKLDEDMKMYLKTNTYVEWGKPWFWNKLRYALPHSRIRALQKLDQKHANMMIKIDDKFGLASPSFTHPESTPPVMVVDPPLMKNHQLSYDGPGVETPPAEHRL